MLPRETLKSREGHFSIKYNFYITFAHVVPRMHSIVYRVSISLKGSKQCYKVKLYIIAKYSKKKKKNWELLIYL